MTQVHIEATKAFITGFDIEALDPESKAVNPVSGQDNPYYNIGVFYQLGSLVDQAAYNAESAQGRLDTAEQLKDDEQERNGKESVQFAILSDRFAQAEAHFNNAKMFFDTMETLFNALSGFTWGVGRSMDGDRWGRKWYEAEKDRRSTKRTLSPKAPTKKQLADRKAAMLAALD